VNSHSSAYDYIKSNSRVKVGQIWMSKMSVMDFRNNVETGTKNANIIQKSY